ncbi:MAG TPA: glycosyltransferase family 39 protein [Candidatus Acidoferrum sp.]|nr:glycosyltransferase family 39 protein [Candidatus Acidoferrum sp.]
MIDQRWRVAFLAPLALAAALFLPGIGQRILYIGDEARYALLARTMVETGDWLVPRIGAEVHMEKSPLFIWTIAAFSLAGRRVTELTAVLPAALSGIAGVGATLVLGRRLFGSRAGLLSALVLATVWGYYWHARMALADIMVTCFAIGAAAAFATVVASGESRRGPMAICWACLGLGLSAKGPVGLMPLIPFAAFLVWEEGWRALAKLRPLMGALIVAAISAPWVLGFALASGESYVESVVLADYVGPRLRAWDRAGELFFAAGPIGVGFLPWVPFLPSALRQGWWRAQDAGLRRRFRFLLVWVLAYVIVITLLPHKRDRYLLATYPVLAIMVGWLWDRWAEPAVAQGLRLNAWIWAAVAVLIASLLLFPVRGRPELMALVPLALAGKLVVVGLFLAAAVLAVVAAHRGRALATFTAICVPMALLLAYEGRVYVRQHNRMFDVKSLAQRLAARATPADQLVTYRYQHLALQFYAGRPVERALTPEQVRTLASDGRAIYLVTDDRAWPVLANATARPWGVVDQATIGGRRLVVATTERP